MRSMRHHPVSLTRYLNGLVLLLRYGSRHRSVREPDGFAALKTGKKRTQAFGHGETTSL